MKNCFIGFDTSNYTTSAAICSEEGRVVANLKRPLAVEAGERGLRQSDAVFAHVRNLPSLTDELSDALRVLKLTPLAIGVSSRPRDVEGSYMPCFLCGVAAAHAFASQAQLPIFEVSHQGGHVMAAAYSSGAQDKLLGGEFLAFHVSGGTTEALWVKPNARGFSTELVGETADLNAGQAIDRVGVALGLKFPAGAELEKLAKSYEGKIPKPKISVADGRCNLSGLENLALSLYEREGDSSLVAAFTFDFVCRTLTEMCSQIIGTRKEVPVLFAGGVMSNTYMRDALSARFDAHFASPAFASDNAAGVALLCRRTYMSGY